MQLKTSTNIAIKFTLYVISLFFILGLMINVGFFVQRNRGEMNRLHGGEPIFKPNKVFKEPREKIIKVPNTPELVQEIEEHIIINNIAKIDDTYVMYTANTKAIKIVDITHTLEMQQNLLRLTIIIIASGAMLTFLISRIFVQSSLQKINELVDYVQDIDIHNLNKPVPLSGPEDDEIRIIAKTLQNSLDTIKTQTDSLKDFVSYASHELKTPLATIHGLIDLGIKKDDIQTTGPKIKKTLTEMNDLLDSLVQITKREFTTLHHENTDIIPLLHTIIENQNKQFEDKKIILVKDIPNQFIISAKSEIITIILSNLIHNAYKFTNSDDIITIVIKGKLFTIHNTGSAISPDDQQKIRQRFWKKNTKSNEGYGLGLYMVKLLVEKLGRTIILTSNDNQGTTFTLTMK